MLLQAMTAGKSCGAVDVGQGVGDVPDVGQEAGGDRKSERVEKMIAAFQAAREHPAEKVAELKEKVVDLIKYENLKVYREHVKWSSSRRTQWRPSR